MCASSHSFVFSCRCVIQSMHFVKKFHVENHLKTPWPRHFLPKAQSCRGFNGSAVGFAYQNSFVQWPNIHERTDVCSHTSEALQRHFIRLVCIGQIPAYITHVMSTMKEIDTCVGWSFGLAFYHCVEKSAARLTCCKYEQQALLITHSLQLAAYML